MVQLRHRSDLLHDLIDAHHRGVALDDLAHALTLRDSVGNEEDLAKRALAEFLPKIVHLLDAEGILAYEDRRRDAELVREVVVPDPLQVVSVQVERLARRELLPAPIPGGSVIILVIIIIMMGDL